MKALIVCISACICGLHANAQSTNNISYRPSAKPVKGYYSIYKNYEKLSAAITDTAKYQSTQPLKGYYGIGNNNSKLSVTTQEGATNRRKRPEIKKGYYSIGNNKSRLN